MPPLKLGEERVRAGQQIGERLTINVLVHCHTRHLPGGAAQLADPLIKRRLFRWRVLLGAGGTVKEMLPEVIDDLCKRRIENLPMPAGVRHGPLREAEAPLQHDQPARAGRRGERGGGLPGMKVIEDREALGALIELDQVAFEGQQAERPPWRTNSATTRISEASG